MRAGGSLFEALVASPTLRSALLSPERGAQVPVSSMAEPHLTQFIPRVPDTQSSQGQFSSEHHQPLRGPGPGQVPGQREERQPLWSEGTGAGSHRPPLVLRECSHLTLPQSPGHPRNLPTVPAGGTRGGT